MAGGNLLLCQLVQDFRSAGAFISNYLMTGALLQLLDQLRRKARLRKGLKGRLHLQPHHLPVAGHGILTQALFTQLSIIAKRLFLRLHLF